jgi:hypothetical protein
MPTTRLTRQIGSASQPRSKAHSDKTTSQELAFFIFSVEWRQVDESRSLLNILRQAGVILAGLCSLGMLVAMAARPNTFGIKNGKVFMLTVLFWLSVIIVIVGVWTLVDKLRQP